MKRIILIVILLIGVSLIAIALSYPIREYIFKEQQLGDLNTKGGAEITFQFDMTNIPEAERNKVFNESKGILSRRIEFFGLYPFMQDSSNYEVVVRLANVRNLDLLATLLGTTAQLDFREYTNPNASISATTTVADLLNMTKSVGITGNDLTHAQVTFDNTTGAPQVAITFNAAGTTKLANVTRRLVGKPLAIFLDNKSITSPVIKQEITDGSAVINGQFTQDQAETLALQLNAGALPTPVSILEKHIIKAK